MLMNLSVYQMVIACLVLGILAILIYCQFTRHIITQRTDHFRNLSEASFEAIILSKDGVVCDCNDQVEVLTGYSRSELIGQSLYMLFDSKFHEQIHQNVITGYSQTYEAEGVHKGGSLLQLEVRGKTFESWGHRMRASSLRDISRRRLEETRLRKLSTAVEHSPSSIVITDTLGRIEYVNPAFSRLTGYSFEEVLGQDQSILKAGDQPPELYQEMWDFLNRGEEWRGEIHNMRKDGSLFWEMVSISPVYDQRGVMTHCVAVKEDITERKELRDQFEQLAQFDHLTGLPNRRMFLSHLNQAVASSRRSGKGFALLFIDLDGFKLINDNYGHAVGDTALRIVSARLSTGIRTSDVVGRIGGDEFVLLLTNIADYQDAGQVAEKILMQLSAAIPLPGGKQEMIGASIGISVFPNDADEANSLLKAADMAMYHVKKNGKRSYCFYQNADRLSS